MSTYWYFECTDHTPPLRSADEISQHTDNHHFRHAVELASARPLPVSAVDLGNEVDRYFDQNARRFLASHPSCTIGLVNEYEVRRPLVPSVASDAGPRPSASKSPKPPMAQPMPRSTSKPPSTPPRPRNMSK